MKLEDSDGRVSAKMTNTKFAIMDIPSSILTNVREGKAVLFLGAGASRDTKDSKGKRPPSGSELAKLLAGRFLGGKFENYPLQQVADYAISESSLPEVQEYIKELFQDLCPSAGHTLVATFSWAGIVTTNFDLLIEKSYENNSRRYQVLHPMVDNNDRVDEILRDRGNLLLLKLHGCIRRLNNPKCPLILSTDQYVQYKRGRDRLFERFKDWARERHIVFIGYSMRDPDLNAVLLDLGTDIESRQRFHVVVPEFDPIERSYWEGKKMSLVKGTFTEFMTSLDSQIDRRTRVLVQMRSVDTLPISQRFRVRDPSISDALQRFLETDVTYVKSVTGIPHLDPREFYRGANPGFAAIEQRLDVSREVADGVLVDHILEEKSEPEFEFVLLQGHAGSGKSVILKRIAWEAAHEYDRLALFLNPYGVLPSGPIQELINLCKERIFLFVDNVADREQEVRELIRNIGPEGRWVTIIAAERTNEWNVYGQELSPLVTAEYDVRYLSYKEIDQLLGLLEHHKALGELEHSSPEERRDAFVRRASRQLLVALHEATFGVPFEDIIEDEYEAIRPEEAQRLYLAVCFMNRLGVPVRAGLIARLYNIAFEEFEKRFFRPLERVVFTDMHPSLRDHVYRARHRHVAEMVCERVLRDQEEKFDLLIRILREMNLSYSTDRDAFVQFLQGRTLLSVFPNHELVSRVFDLALEKAPDDPYVYHQLAVYEMARPNGSTGNAAKYLAKATRLSPRSNSIKHSFAVLSLRRATEARSEIESSTYLAEGENICNELKRFPGQRPYAYATAAKIQFMRTQRLMEGTQERADSEVENGIRKMERALTEGLQESPGNPHILKIEADFAKLLNDSSRALKALEKAFEANPRSAYIAIRLARHFQDIGDTKRSKGILEKAVDANPGERRLQFALGKLMLDAQISPGDVIEYHLKRSFTKGDSNYEAQLLYGRQLFINGKLDESRDIFRALAKAKVGYNIKRRVVYPLEGVHRGRVAKSEAAYFLLLVMVNTIKYIVTG